MNVQRINAFMPRADFHVVPAQGLWAVKTEGISDYSGVFQTQLEARSYAMGLARMAATSVVTHNRHGVIDHVESYPLPPVDTPRIMVGEVN